MSAMDVQDKIVRLHSCRSRLESDEKAKLSLSDTTSLADTPVFYSCCSCDHSPVEKEPSPSGPRAACPGRVSLSPYDSSRIQSLKESRAQFNTDLDFNVHCSKSTWTELETSQEEDHDNSIREMNMEAFKELEKHPMFRRPYELEFDESQLIAEGGEAKIYATAASEWRGEFIFVHDCAYEYLRGPKYDGPYGSNGTLMKENIPRCGRCKGGTRAGYFHETFKKRKVGKKLVVKVFREGFPLSDFLKRWSPRWLADTGFSVKAGGSFNQLCWAVDAQVLNNAKFVGRFALVLPRYECDLRKLIDDRKMSTSRTDKSGPPFLRDHTLLIVYKLAKAMACLHELGLLHRDLKASNVLCNCKRGLVDELSVADFESSSIGHIIGTRFWRAPEILKAVKTRIWTPHPVTREADVYSFAMTCYEVITGLIPLEDDPQNQYDEVINGRRPELPDNFCPELNGIIRRCWHDDPLQRPSFAEIVSLLEEMRAGYIFEHS